MTQPAALASHLGYWMRIVSNHVSLGFARRLDERGVTVAEWVMLRQLYDAPSLRPSRLAAQLTLTRGAISKLADRLIAKGLVERRAGGGDARSHEIALSDTGRAIVPVLAELADRNDADAFGGLVEEDRVALARILRVLVAKHGMAEAPLD
ncbi:MAG: MarR family transcriptional regulator [Proteobacteria bacterium]|nr:MarR family transcriptional regulator [Pseudomonadota bacterium]